MRIQDLEEKKKKRTNGGEDGEKALDADTSLVRPHIILEMSQERLDDSWIKDGIRPDWAKLLFFFFFKGKELEKKTKKERKERGEEQTMNSCPHSVQVV